MYYNYVLENKKNNHLYTRYTTDLKNRLLEHNNGQNQSTKKDRPWKLIYYEACLNEKDAKRREKYLKITQGKRLLKRRLKEYIYNK